MTSFISRYIISAALVVGLVVGVEEVRADDIAGPVETDSTQTEKSKGFNVADFIFEHVGDSYEWHILTVNGHHISIPLPIILYSRTSGLQVFLSNKFHNSTRTYKGFKWEDEGKYAGKIVQLNSAGEVDDANPLPLNFSITKNVLTIFMLGIFLCWLFISIAKQYKKRPNSAPTGIQNMLELIVLFVRDEIALPSLGEKQYQRFMPFLLTLFFFIWFANMLGLIPIFPGGANVTGNIAVTMVLAVFTFVVITVNGNKHYWKDIFNAPGVPWFLKLPIPIMPLVEIMGMFTKPIVLMVRLFANILAGHMVGIVFMSLIFIFAGMKFWLGYVAAPISLIFSIFMTALELLVALIQAYVFTLLSAIYIGMATTEHE